MADFWFRKVQISDFSQSTDFPFRKVKIFHFTECRFFISQNHTEFSDNYGFNKIKRCWYSETLLKINQTAFLTCLSNDRVQIKMLQVFRKKYKCLFILWRSNVTIDKTLQERELIVFNIEFWFKWIRLVRRLRYHVQLRLCNLTVPVLYTNVQGSNSLTQY